MANENVFTEKAELYQKGRQGYAPQAIKLVLEKYLVPGGTVADIGSGTGILSAEFLDRGIETYCVEPNEKMHMHAEQRFLSNPLFHAIKATAEHTTLPAQCVDLITAGSSFHWFDAAAFRMECLRILRPGCPVCILHNMRDDTDPFTQAQHKLCETYCPGFTSLMHGALKTQAQADSFFGGTMERYVFSFPLTYKKELFLQRTLSSSYAPKQTDAGYALFVEKMWELMHDASSDNSIVIPNQTLLLAGTIALDDGKACME